MINAQEPSRCKGMGGLCTESYKLQPVAIAVYSPDPCTAQLQGHQLESHQSPTQHRHPLEASSNLHMWNHVCLAGGHRILACSYSKEGGISPSHWQIHPILLCSPSCSLKFTENPVNMDRLFRGASGVFIHVSSPGLEFPSRKLSSALIAEVKSMHYEPSFAISELCTEFCTGAACSAVTSFECMSLDAETCTDKTLLRKILWCLHIYDWIKMVFGWCFMDAQEHIGNSL